jgi:hypothetical protein
VVVLVLLVVVLVLLVVNVFAYAMPTSAAVAKPATAVSSIAPHLCQRALQTFSRWAIFLP